MKIKSYTWAGVRTEDFGAAIQFYADVLGLPLVGRYDDEQSAMFELPSGQNIEVFGSRSEYYALHGCPVLGFEVEDIQSARTELKAKAVQFVTEIKGSPNEGAAWCYFRSPDGTLFELIQQQPPPDVR